MYDYICDYWKCKTVLKKREKRAVLYVRGTHKPFNVCDHCLSQISILGFEKVQFKYHKDYSFYITDENGNVLSLGLESETDEQPEKPFYIPIPQRSCKYKNIELTTIRLLCHICGTTFRYFPVKRNSRVKSTKRIWDPRCQNYGCNSHAFKIFSNNTEIGKCSKAGWIILDEKTTTSDLFSPEITWSRSPRIYKGIILETSKDKQSILFHHLEWNRKARIIKNSLLDITIIPTELYHGQEVYLIAMSSSYNKSLAWVNLNLPENFVEETIVKVKGEIIDYFPNLEQIIFHNDDDDKKYVIPGEFILNKVYPDQNDQKRVELTIKREILIDNQYKFLNYPYYSFKRYFQSIENILTINNNYFLFKYKNTINELEKTYRIKLILEEKEYEKNARKKETIKEKYDNKPFTRQNILKALGLPEDLDSVDFCIACGQKMNEGEQQDIICPSCSLSLEIEINREIAILPEGFRPSNAFANMRLAIDYINYNNPQILYDDPNEILFSNQGIYYKNALMINFNQAVGTIRKRCTKCWLVFDSPNKLLVHYLARHENKIPNPHLNEQIEKIKLEKPKKTKKSTSKTNSRNLQEYY